MTRILVIGTSHTGAIKFGFETLDPAPDNIDVDYIAAHRKKLLQLGFDGVSRFGALEGTQPDEDTLHILKERYGDVVIDIAAYDVVLMIGLDTDPTFIRTLLRSTDVDGLREMGLKRRMSRPAFEAIFEDFCQRSVPEPAWHHWSGGRLILIETPRRNETVLVSDDEVEDATGYRETLDRVSERVAALCADKGITFLRQPPETIAENGLTKAEYGRGSRRMRSGELHAVDDKAHTNGDYGQLVWGQVLAAIA
jgi:hypothetical protein